jgi:hypothetical protein
MAKTEFRLLTGYQGEAGYCWDCWACYDTLDLALEDMRKLLNGPGMGTHPQLLPIRILEAAEGDEEEAGVLVYEQGLSVEEWGGRIDRGDIDIHA